MDTKAIHALILFSVTLGLFTIITNPVLGGSLRGEGGMKEDWIQITSEGFTNNTNLFGITNFVNYKGYLYASVDTKKGGAEIWRTADYVHWENIVQNGFGNPNNSAITLFVAKGNLYAGTHNEAEGAEIWVSNDGVKFTKIVSKGLGDMDNIGISHVPVTFRDKILVAVQNGQVGNIRDGAEIWISEDGNTFFRSQRGGLGDIANILIYFHPTPFKNHLYIGTYNPVTGGELLRTEDGVRWEKVVDNGFGDKENFAVNPQIVFNDYLYVIASNLNGLNVYRSRDGKNWEKVVANGFNYGKYKNLYGVLVEIDGVLYLSTASTPKVGAFQLWRSYDGKNWTQIGSSGFGNENNYFLSMFKASDAHFYLVTLNMLDGTEVWKSKDTEKWEMIFKDNGSNRPTGDFREFDGYLYLMLFDYNRGIEIWRYKTPLITATTTTIPQTTLGPTYTQTRATTTQTTQSPQQTKTTVTVTPQTTTTYIITATTAESRWEVTGYAVVAAAAGVAAVLLYFILKLRLMPRPPPPPPPPK